MLFVAMTTRRSSRLRLPLLTLLGLVSIACGDDETEAQTPSSTTESGPAPETSDSASTLASQTGTDDTTTLDPTSGTVGSSTREGSGSESSDTEPSADDEPHYVFSLVSATDDRGAADFHAASTEVALAHQGRSVAPPIRVLDELDNDALPSVTSPFPGDYTMLYAFESEADARAMFEDTADARAVLEGGGAEQIHVLMLSRPPVPGFPEFPLLDAAALREQPPAFLLMNGIQFADAPDVPANIGRFAAATAELQATAGTVFFATLETVEELQGAYPFQFFFLTEWTDRTTFDAVHSDPAFLEAALGFRNPSLGNFTEEEGRIAPELAAPRS